MAVAGSELVGAALKRQGVDTFFYLMGAPMLDVERSSMRHGIRGIDVRHEQAAAMMAHAYSRVLNKAGVCMACSGPGALNLGTGLANARIDCSPVVALGGSTPITEYGMEVFQEFDLVAAMTPLTKWAGRVYETRRIPEMIDLAFRKALSGKPGPVYLDLPGDVLFGTAEESRVVWPSEQRPFVRAKPAGDPALVERAVDLIAKAKRPVLLSGSGVLWSGAAEKLHKWVDQSGMPFFTTPQGRGVIPEDHPQAFLGARSVALKEADLIMVVGTRLNYVFGHGLPPRFSADVKMIRIDIDPMEIDSSQRADVGLVGDAGAVLAQFAEAARKRVSADMFAEWRKRLEKVEAGKREEVERALSTDQLPIHPLRLCKEVRDFIGRDTILVVDGQETLNYGRQSIPSYLPSHRLNSGPFGIMGVGLPFGVGAKAARPDKQVVVLHGDGSFGMNGLELDTARRHKIPLLVIVSVNGGWSADPKRDKPGRDLGYTRYDQLAQALDCHTEYVEKPADIRPALERAAKAVKSGRSALVNVVTDAMARAGGARFSASST
jgi:acetolactate synthase-1/2/3 large subunit